MFIHGGDLYGIDNGPLRMMTLHLPELVFIPPAKVVRDEADPAVLLVLTAEMTKEDTLRVDDAPHLLVPKKRITLCVERVNIRDAFSLSLELRKPGEKPNRLAEAIGDQVRVVWDLDDRLLRGNQLLR